MLLVLAAAPVAAQDDATYPRLLLIYSSHSALAANIEVTSGIKSVLDAAPTSGYEIYSEYRDAERFPGPDAARRFVEEIEAKYRGLQLDAVVALGPEALRFAAENLDDVAPETPVVFGGVTAATLEEVDVDESFHGVVGAFDLSGTLALARKLQPTAKRVVVFTGSAPFDEAWRIRAREEFAGVADAEFDYVSDLSLEAFQARAADLDQETILIVLSIFEDATGRRFIPRNATAAIAGRSSAPTYGVYSTYVGNGIVGGSFATFEAIGEAMARLTLRAIDGELVGAKVDQVAPRPVVDWRQMQRFGLDVDLLPARTQLLFYDPTPWERYRLQILLAVAVILAQSGTIVALVVQGRRKRAAEMEVVARRLELAHLSRIAQLGELSGAVAHELNQPLTSILANAEAGSLLLARDPADIEEVRAILSDIADDDRRAARTITELRRLMTKGEAELESVDLNEVVSATIHLARSELVVREVRVETRLARDDLRLRGNRAQLQQVLLNLMLNAADAMAALAPEMRQMAVETGVRANGWRELAVRDNGPGLTVDQRERAFQPFATSKPNGLGLGLSICRTIAQAHGGTLGFDGSIERGARVVLALPPA